MVLVLGLSVADTGSTSDEATRNTDEEAENSAEE